MKTLKYILVKAMSDVISVVESMFKAGVWLFLIYVLFRIGHSMVDTAFSLLHLYVEGFYSAFITGLLLVVAGILASNIIKWLPLFGWNDRIFTGQMAIILLGGTRWRDRCAGILACGALLTVGGVVVATLVFDTLLTRYVMNGALYVVRIVSLWCGMNYRLMLIALLWLSACLCMASCLSLLIPVLRHKGGRTGGVYRVSGCASIVFYMVGIYRSSLSYLPQLVFYSPLKQYSFIEDFVMYASFCDGYSVAYTVMHNFVLPVVLPMLLNVVFLILLCRSNRCADTVGGGDIPNITARQEEEPPSNDIECFRCLTRIVISVVKHEDLLEKLLFGYVPARVATLNDEDMLRIMNKTGGYLRRRWLSVPNNARQFLAVVQEFGSFRAYIESLTLSSGSDKDQSSLGLGTQSVLVANDMRWRGFKQVGPSSALELLGKMYGIRNPYANLHDFHVFSKHR